MYEGPDAYIFALNEVVEQNENLEIVKATIDYDSLIDPYTLKDAIFAD